MHDSRRTRLILGVLLVAALALITVDSRDVAGGPISGLRGIGGTIFGSAESLVGSVARPVAGFFGNVTSGSASQGKIEGLQRELIRLRTELSQARLSKAQEAQLQRLLRPRSLELLRCLARDKERLESTAPATWS